MPKSWLSTASAARRWFAGASLTLLSITAMAAPDFAAVPAAVVDPVMRFLADQRLISTPAEPVTIEGAFVERMRDQASEMVLTAMNFLGVRYRRGGDTAESGFDCSGFTRHVFEMSVGKVLPRRADEQATTAGLLSVKREELKPGDLVFFNTMRRTFSHVGIYVGGGKFIHAPKPGGEVRVEDMSASYWTRRFTGARRADLVLDTSPADTSAPRQPTASARNVY